MAYAHAVIETPDARFERGESVTKDSIDGYDELVEAGSIANEKPDPVEFEPQHPDEIEIDGVRYVKATDGATNGEASSA